TWRTGCSRLRSWQDLLERSTEVPRSANYEFLALRGSSRGSWRGARHGGEGVQLYFLRRLYGERMSTRLPREVGFPASSPYVLVPVVAHTQEGRMKIALYALVGIAILVGVLSRNRVWARVSATIF